MRLGNGEEFGEVLVELRSAEDCHPPVEQLPMSSAAVVPDDTSQPVRIYACVVEIPGNLYAHEGVLRVFHPLFGVGQARTSANATVLWNDSTLCKRTE